MPPHFFPSAVLFAASLSVPAVWAAESPVKPSAPASEAPDIATQLATAQRELRILRQRHADNHPLVLRQRGRIADLHQELRKSQAGAPKLDAAGQLELAKQDLAALREKYTDAHPAVMAQQRKVTALEKR